MIMKKARIVSLKTVFFSFHSRVGNQRSHASVMDHRRTFQRGVRQVGVTFSNDRRHQSVPHRDRSQV